MKNSLYVGHGVRKNAQAEVIRKTVLTLVKEDVFVRKGI